MKLALIGVGGINVHQHTPGLMKYSKEVAPLSFLICDPSAERCSEWCKQFGEVPQFASVDELLSKERPDAVLVCVPERLTCEVVLRFLAERIPVLTEKPPGNTSAEVIRLRDTAAEGPRASCPPSVALPPAWGSPSTGSGPRATSSGVDVSEANAGRGGPGAGAPSPGIRASHSCPPSPVEGEGSLHAVAFNRRWSPLIFKLKQLASDPTLPKPTCYTCTFTRSKRYDVDFAATAIHGLDTMRFLGGDVATLTVSVAEHRGAEPYKNFLLVGRFASGAQFQMTVLPVSGRAVERYTVIAEDVTLEACAYMPGVTEPAALSVFRGKRQEAAWDEAVLGVADAHESVRCGFYQEAEHFLNGLRNGGSLGVSFAEALQSVQLMEFLRTARDGDVWRAAAKTPL